MSEREIADPKPLVRVTWIDSGMSHMDGWEKVEEIVDDMIHDEGMKAMTVGYLIHDDGGDRIIVAQTHDPLNDLYLNAQMIWRPSILECVELGVAV